MHTKLDSLIGYLFPGWAVRRLNARAAMLRFKKSQRNAAANRKQVRLDEFLSSDSGWRGR